jgi:hypothetical protein
MPRPEQYQRIAERYANAADLTCNHVSESSGFSAYHTFESIGCAWIRHHGQVVPRPHPAKLNRFVGLSRRYPFGRGVALLATLLNAMRNQLLYPIPNGTGGYSLPETRLRPRDAADLIRRVRGILRQVSDNM